jgi:hypothetical protein
MKETNNESNDADNDGSCHVFKEGGDFFMVIELRTGTHSAASGDSAWLGWKDKGGGTRRRPEPEVGRSKILSKQHIDEKGTKDDETHDSNSRNLCTHRRVEFCGGQKDS